MPHLFTHSLDHPECKFGVAVGEEGREREAHYLERDFCSVWFILLALYCLYILRKFLLGFLPHEGFLG
jgi:hypothetical protein